MQVNSHLPPQPKQTIDGFVLTDLGDKLSMHFVGMLFGLIFCGSGIFVFTIEDSWFNRLFAMPFILVGLALIVLPLVGLWRIRSMSPGQLTARDWPLQQGTTATLTYRRPGRRGAVPNIDQVSARAEVREVARYRQGTDTHTVTEEIGRFPVRAQVLTMPGALVAELKFVIPSDMPASFHARNNHIDWWIFVEPTAGGEPVDGSSFKVQVDR